MARRTPPTPDENWLTLAQAAKRLGVSRQALYGRVERGSLAAIAHPTRTLWIREADARHATRRPLLGDGWRLSPNARPVAAEVFPTPLPRSSGSRPPGEESPHSSPGVPRTEAAS